MLAVDFPYYRTPTSVLPLQIPFPTPAPHMIRIYEKAVAFPLFFSVEVTKKINSMGKESKKNPLIILRLVNVSPFFFY